MSVEFLVITPTYRRPEYLLESVRSALGQTGANVKIIVIDDCPDGSAEAPIKTLGDARVTYLRNPKPTGGWPAIVRNQGLDYARNAHMGADFVHFLDDDDIAPEGCYAAVAQAFAEHKDIGVIFGIVEPFIKPSDDPRVRALQEKTLQGELRYFASTTRTARLYRKLGALLPFKGTAVTEALYAMRVVFGPPLFVCSSVFFRHACVAELKEFDTTIRLMEDSDFHVRAVRRFGVQFVDRPTVNYRIGSASALMHSLDLPPAERAKEHHDVQTGIAQKNTKLRKEIGSIKFYAGKICFRFLISPYLSLQGILRRVRRMLGQQA